MIAAAVVAVSVSVVALGAGASSAPAVGTAGTDPRPALVEPQLDNRFDEALARTESALADGGDEAAGLGLDYLRGYLLDRLGRRGEAADAFGRALSTAPRLEMFCRYHMAGHLERSGHPEVAAGLIATVVSKAPPSPLLDDATELFVRVLAAGGDCRLLGGIDRARIGQRNRRLIEVAAAECERDAHPDRARELLVKVLRESAEDEPARRAADDLAVLFGDESDVEIALLLGRAYHWHRQFDRARLYFERAAAAFGPALSGEQFDAVYTLTRGTFWQGDFPAAGTGFADLAGRTTDRRRQAQALYQQARAQELADQWPLATATYRRAFQADPLGNLADAALAGALRISWRRGDEAAADEVYELLIARRQWIPSAARASLYLAASDLVAGRGDRAGHWLDLAERAGRDTEIEVAYWRGRLAELDGEPAAAVGQYLRVEQRDRFHPLAEDARSRLAAPPLAAAARALGIRLAASARPEDRYGAWLLLGDGSGAGRAALARVRARFAADPSVTLTLTPVPVQSWPLWTSPLREPEEQLLALGIWGEGAPAIGRHFPVGDPDLGYTGSLLLARAGEVRRALQRADAQRRRYGSHMPPPLVPVELRRLLYPFAFSETLVVESLKRQVDPYLLAALLREESRFDPRALSGASARGLAQFVEPTARELGQRIGMGELSTDDLYRPEVAIALAAAHLHELSERFHGAIPMVVAAYNAGAAQAELWHRYCFSDEAAEYITKVNFSETRGYVENVLRSWGEYRDLYRQRRDE